MDNGSRNPLKSIKDDIRTVIGAATVAFATGFSAAVMSGAWRQALLAVCGIAILALVTILIAAARGHARQLGELKFEDMRAEDVEKRQAVKFEREQREHFTRAATRPCDAPSEGADVSAMLERARKNISSGRASPIELLLVSDAEPNAPRPVAQAGRFDHAVLSDPARLIDWIESLEGRAYGCAIFVKDKAWRIFGIGETVIDSHDRFEVQRVASHLTALKLAHLAACSSSLEESA